MRRIELAFIMQNIITQCSRSCVAQDSQIGMISALRPWVGMTAAVMAPLIGDRLSVHRGALELGRFETSECE